MALDLALEHDWRCYEPYLYGVDLFNQAFFWEAHEAWEEVWHAVGKRTLPGRMVQGMIQVAAALLQRHRGIARGAERNLAKASVHFDAVEEHHSRLPGELRYLGVELDSWRSQVAGYLLPESGPFPFVILR